MRIVLIWVLLMPVLAYGQNDSAIIFSSELPDIIVVDKKTSKRKIFNFRLSKYASYISSVIQCGENIGVIVPASIENELYIENVNLPIDTYYGDPTTKPTYSYYIIFPAKDTNKLIPVIPQKITYSRKKLTLQIHQRFFPQVPVKHFVFMLVPLGWCALVARASHLL